MKVNKKNKNLAFLSFPAKEFCPACTAASSLDYYDHGLTRQQWQSFRDAYSTVKTTQIIKETTGILNIRIEGGYCLKRNVKETIRKLFSILADDKPKIGFSEWMYTFTDILNVKGLPFNIQLSKEICNSGNDGLIQHHNVNCEKYQTYASMFYKDDVDNDGFLSFAGERKSALHCISGQSFLSEYQYSSGRLDYKTDYLPWLL